MKRGEDTKERILAGAMILARNGLDRVTLRNIGASLKISRPLALYYFGSVDALREATIARAIDHNDRLVIARLIMDDHPCVKDWARAKRQRYLAVLGAR